MSGFFDDASWVLIPEGIKEDVVYAQKPTNGLGDLQFTRASDATRTNSAGVIERTPWNLLQSSNTFNTTWIPAFATVTIGQSGYDGTNNAWLLSKSLADGRISQNVTLTSGAYTYSAYLKAGTKNWGFLRVDGVSIKTAYFNLQNGTLGTASGCTSSILSVGGGWYRCSITFTDSVTIARIYVADANNDLSGTSGNILIQAAQLVEGTDAKPYFATTNRQDVPRLDYRNADGSLNSCPRLLLEPQRTNSIRNSTMVGAVAGSPGTAPTNWATATSGLTQTIVGIGVESGLQYIDLRFNGTSTGTTVTIQQEGVLTAAASVGQVWTSSIYSKVISAPTPPSSYQIRLREGTSGGSFVADGLQTFVPTSSLQRFVYTRTNTGATTAFLQPSIVININSGATYDFTIRIAAPQMELGAYPTTYIPTTTAAVTRIVDGFTRNNIFTNGFITAAGGTWFVDLSNNLSYSTSVFSAIGIGNTTALTTNSIILFQLSSGGERVRIAKYVAGTPTTLHTTTTNNAKIAIKWNGTTADVFVNGVKVVSATSFTPTNMENLNAPNVGMPFQFNQSALFPVPMTDAQCIQMTT